MPSNNRLSSSSRSNIKAISRSMSCFLLAMTIHLPLPCNSFGVIQNGLIVNRLFAWDLKPRQSITRLFEATDDPVTPPREEANLVDQTRYVNSIETLKKEIAKANEQPYEAPEDPPVRVLGRFEVPLRIDTAPGLDLTETAAPEDESTDGGLVLVTSVTGNAADAGLQPFDTIVAVSCPAVEPPFYANVNSESLQTTAIALQTAVAHALNSNVTEIQLEMNRLLAGFYE